LKIHEVGKISQNSLSSWNWVRNTTANLLLVPTGAEFCRKGSY
jgi:hypothetical protein